MTPAAAVYEFNDSEITFIVAESEEQAWAYYRENIEPDATPEEVTCDRVADDRVLTVSYDDHEPGQPSSETKTAGEWARESVVVPSLLASTCW